MGEIEKSGVRSQNSEGKEENWTAQIEGKRRIF